MKTRSLESDYEPMRAWALFPSSIRPPGVAQLLRGGMVTWAHQIQPLSSISSNEVSQPLLSHGCVTPLSIIVAAMIAEVCQ